MKTKLHLFFALSILLLTHSCTKENLSLADQSEERTALIFQKEFLSTYQDLNLKLDWGEIFKFKDQDDELIGVRLIKTNRFEGNPEQYEKNNYAKQKPQRKFEFVIKKERAAKKPGFQRLKILAFRTDNLNANQNSPALLLNSLTGLAIYFDMTGDFIEGYEYRNGLRVGTIGYYAKSLGSDSASPYLIAPECVTHYEYTYEQTCWYQTAGGNTTFLGCSSWELVSIETYEVCYYDPGDGGGSGGTISTYDSHTNYANESTMASGEPYFSTCESSFNFVRIQEAYYTEVLNLYHSYLFADINNNVYDFDSYSISNLCIQVRNRNSLGQFISSEQAKGMAAEAMDLARRLTFSDFEDRLAFNLQKRFLENFRYALKREFGGYPTVRVGPCQGSAIPKQPNKFNVFGICLNVR